MPHAKRSRLVCRGSVASALAVLAVSGAAAATNATISTVAGTGSSGSFGDGGQARQAELRKPEGAAFMSDGSLLIADADNEVIRRVSNGVITRVAGTRDHGGFSGDGGPATAAKLGLPVSVSPTLDGGYLIADQANHRVRKVDAQGIIRTIAGTGKGEFNTSSGAPGDGQPAAVAPLQAPSDAVERADGAVLIADRDNHRIRLLRNGVLTTVAGNGTGGERNGNGPATAAELQQPTRISLLANGMDFLFTDQVNKLVYKVVGTTITTVAGNRQTSTLNDGGLATAAALEAPFGVAALAGGAYLVADRTDHRIRRISAGGTISTDAGTGSAGFAGDGAPADAAKIREARGVTVSPDGGYLISDTGNHRVRQVPSNDLPAFTGAPIAPSGLATSAPGTGQLDLTWNDMSANETGFELQRSTQTNFASPVTTTLAPDAETRTITGLTAGTTYYFRIRALRDTLTSSWSQTSGRTSSTTSTPAPPVPGSVAATAVSSSRVDVNWTDPASDETGFEVQYDDAPGFTSPSGTTFPAGTISITLAGLTASTQYEVRVRTVRGASTSAWSPTQTVTTPAPPAMPAAPTALSAPAVGSSDVTLTWNDASADETDFVLERDTAVGFSAPTAVVLPAGTTTFAVTGLAASTRYFFRLKARRGTDSSAWTPVTQATTQTPAPVRPSALNAAVVSHSQIDLQWTDASTDETGFQVQRDTSSTFAGAVSVVVPAGTSSWSATGLTPGVTHHFRVRTKRGTEYSAWSDGVSALTPLAPLPAPANVATSEPTSSGLTLSWTDASSDETGFVIERDTSEAFGSPESVQAPADATSFVFTGLAPDSVHHFRVRAVREDDASPWSATATGRTARLPIAPPVSDPPAPPAPPAAPAATPTSGPPSDAPLVTLPPLGETVATPVVGKRVTVMPSIPGVLVRTAGSKLFRPLAAAESLPLGSVLDATVGEVAVQAAAGGGKLDTMRFSGGAFSVQQKKAVKPVAEIRLFGKVPTCSAGAASAVARTAAKTRTRRLWGSGHGNFRTRGRHAAATVRGTIWLTEDRCDGTLVKVKRGLVEVLGYRKGSRKIMVPAGKQTFVRAARKP